VSLILCVGVYVCVFYVRVREREFCVDVCVY
jgi:hypothetical protein